MNNSYIELELKTPDLSIPAQLIETKGAPSGRKPLFVFLHGAGERGEDNQAQTTWVVPDLLKLLSDWNISAYVLIPQCPKNQFWVNTDWTLNTHIRPPNPSAPLQAVMQGVHLCEQLLPVNLDQKWLLGISMGGFGVWDWISRNPTEFKAAVPICGGADLAAFNRELTTSIWTFHGAKDPIISVQRTRTIVKRLQALERDIQYHEFQDIEHNSWTPAFTHSPFISWMKTLLTHTQTR